MFMNIKYIILNFSHKQVMLEVVIEMVVVREMVVMVMRVVLVTVMLAEVGDGGR